MVIFLSIVVGLLVLSFLSTFRKLWIIERNPLLKATCPDAVKSRLQQAGGRTTLLLIIAIGLLIYFW